jgi:hypothetical protein
MANTEFTSVSRNKLQQAFGLAHKLSESHSVPAKQRKQFRAIAILLWEAHGEPGAPPPEAGAILLAKFGVYGDRRRLADRNAEPFKEQS